LPEEHESAPENVMTAEMPLLRAVCNCPNHVLLLIFTPTCISWNGLLICGVNHIDTICLKETIVTLEIEVFMPAKA